MDNFFVSLQTTPFLFEHGSKILIAYVVIFFNACNTITGTVEGTGRGIIKDVKTIHHYSTCIFTDTQCGDLDLKK